MQLTFSKMNEEEIKNDIRCSLCLKEFNKAEIAKMRVYDKCPNCGTGMHPVRIKDDMTFQANWQDLRILAIYSQRLVHSLPNTPENNEYRHQLENILRKLIRYQPIDANGFDPTPPPPKEKKKTDGPVLSPYFKNIK